MSRLLSAPDDEKRDDSQKKIITFWIGEGKSPPVMDTNWGKAFTLTKEFLITGGEGRKFSHLFFFTTRRKKSGKSGCIKETWRESLLFSLPTPTWFSTFLKLGVVGGRRKSADNKAVKFLPWQKIFTSPKNMCCSSSFTNFWVWGILGHGWTPFCGGKIDCFWAEKARKKNIRPSLPSSSQRRKTKSYLEKITQKPTIFPFLFEGPAHTAVSHICGIEKKLFGSKKKYTQQKLGKQYGGRPFLIPPNSAGIFLPSFFGERNCCGGWKLSSLWRGGGFHFGGVRFQKADFFLSEKILRKKGGEK